MTSVLWLRRDLRRRDHPALLAARDAAGDGELVVAFVVDPRLWEGGGAVRRAWLAATLGATDTAFDGALTLLHGDPRRVVPDLAARVGAGSVHVSRETTPAGRRRDDVVSARLAEARVDWVETGTPYAVGPGLVVNGTGEPYKVFTPFSRAWRAHGWPDPAPTPRTLPLRRLRNDADATGAVRAALAAPDLPDLPPAGEEAALARWRAFRDGALPAYGDDRNRPDVDGTSRLSPYLKLGVLHPRTLLADLAGQRGRGVATYENELAWREFYADVLWRTPRSAWHDLRPELAGLRYDEPADAIVMNEVLYYLPNPLTAVRHHARSLSTDGVMIISVFAHAWATRRLLRKIADQLDQIQIEQVESGHLAWSIAVYRPRRS